MRSLRQVLGRGASGSIAIPQKASSPKSWNTLSTLGAGAVADVDSAGVVYPRDRALSVELWFLSGERWVRGAVDAGVRQIRVAGLPIIETRQRIGEFDVVQTAWADEPGDGRGRVVIDLKNEGDVAVVAAVVVRPESLSHEGSISDLRVVGQLIVADRLPLVDLSRAPGDVAVAHHHGDALFNILSDSVDRLIGEEGMSDELGRASLAAMIPLTPGVDRQLQVLDGREASSVAPAPLDRVVAGWRSHLRGTTEIDLPGWPKHMPTALISSVLGSAADEGGPLGDEMWRPVDDATLAVALGGFGLHWAASSIVDRLLGLVSEGRIDRREWPRVGVACAAIVGSEAGDETLRGHGDVAVSLAGELLSNAPTPGLDQRLHQVVYASHGSAAETDARAIVGRVERPEVLLELARLGVMLPAPSRHVVDEAIDQAPRPLSVEDLALAMIAQAQTDRDTELLVRLRALAGSTWRWGRDGCGDSPHARAALLIGLRSLCVSESDHTIDLLPGLTAMWLGQNLRVNDLPTRAGRCSFAIRWHGPRPALLWEFVGESADVQVRPTVFTCRTLDATFQTTARSGETLLQAPDHLAAR